jgi:hypothetical protein
MSRVVGYHRGYRIAFTEGVWSGRFVEITSKRPELPILPTPKIEIPWSQSETEALEYAHSRINDLLK